MTICYKKSTSKYRRQTKNDEEPRNVINSITNKVSRLPYCSNQELSENVCNENLFSLHSKSKCWHQTKNDEEPRNVLHSITNKVSRLPLCVNQKICENECNVCYEKSFAFSERAPSWHPTKNEKTPRDFFLNSRKKCWFTCDEPECKHDFEIRLYDVVNRRSWCPYCSNKKLCENECNVCFEKSFTSSERAPSWHTTKNEKGPRNVFLNSRKKCWFTCDEPECKHDFDTTLNDVTSGKWCPYCSNKKLCENDCNVCNEKSFASSERAPSWHPTKNEKTQREFFLNSQKKCWFTCDEPDCKHDFETSLAHVNNGRWCPLCNNKTEKKLLKFLQVRYPDKVIYQPKYEWCKNLDTNRFLPFDFEVLGSIIIELDGAQHFKQISNWVSPEKQQERDVYKMDQAVINDKHLIRILQEDVYKDRNNWEDKLLQEIKLLSADTRNQTFSGKIKCIGDCDIYKKYTIT
jgi:hypothetical protein